MLPAPARNAGFHLPGSRGQAHDPDAGSGLAPPTPPDLQRTAIGRAAGAGPAGLIAQPLVEAEPELVEPPLARHRPRVASRRTARRARASSLAPSFASSSSSSSSSTRARRRMTSGSFDASLPIASIARGTRRGSLAETRDARDSSATSFERTASSLDRVARAHATGKVGFERCLRRRERFHRRRARRPTRRRPRPSDGNRRRRRVRPRATPRRARVDAVGEVEEVEEVEAADARRRRNRNRRQRNRNRNRRRRRRSSA